MPRSGSRLGNFSLIRRNETIQKHALFTVELFELKIIHLLKIMQMHFSPGNRQYLVTWSDLVYSHLKFCCIQDTRGRDGYAYEWMRTSGLCAVVIIKGYMGIWVFDRGVNVVSRNLMSQSRRTAGHPVGVTAGGLHVGLGSKGDDSSCRQRGIAGCSEKVGLVQASRSKYPSCPMPRPAHRHPYRSSGPPSLPRRAQHP